MSNYQIGILEPVPQFSRYLAFSVEPDLDPQGSLAALQKIVDGDKIVVGLGESLVRALDGDIVGLRAFPQQVGAGIEVPSTPAALWCWLRGDDRGVLVHTARQIENAISQAFVLEEVIDGFQYRDSRDLTGYEDGTENPQDEAAIEAAVCSGQGTGLDGSSFVAVQQWVHDLDYFESLPTMERDHIIGRRQSDNEELDDAPDSAHVKRTAQESFDPEAFVLRRSMPWADQHGEGLVFVAFGHSFDAFEALLQRMVGAEDGITDGLFRFTRPVSGRYFWCPPMKAGQLDLSAVGV
ncbi:MAG: Dyp-type peroxidase [Candidatus Marinimicrobia bacterium]|nr:Dyp-type peroxidase [Candidatus Neomarinimicrobiota bacterium]